MRIIRSIAEQVALSGNWRRRGSKVGFVPTMGALHEGHMSLVRASINRMDRTVVSIFINPSQFGQGEDFSSYPRTLSQDIRLLAREGVDVVFVPNARSIYPRGFASKVEVGGSLVSGLCGPHRPGHFAGVATVVAKLLNIVRPDSLFLGRKDAQQARIIQRMVRDLHFDVRVRILPTIRQADGLAVSSRNRYLTPRQRKLAPLLIKALRAGREAIRKGAANSKAVRARMRRTLARSRELRIQYLHIVDARTLQPVSRMRGELLLAAAVWLGATRLIDNLPVRAPRR